MTEDLPSIMSDTPAPAPPPHDADTLAMVEAMLDGRPPPDEVLARFGTPEATAERTARAARRRERDWSDLGRYREANAGVEAPELVMIGDSLTEIWGLATPDLFGNRVVNRGISGQTSPQVLLRFIADVVELKPRAVHILCGGNDIAGNTGPNTPEDYQRNIRAMVDLATFGGIRVLLGSITPVLGTIAWSPEAQPGRFIPRLNAWLRAFAAERGTTFIDYHAALEDGAGQLQARYSGDGAHLTRPAYLVMRDMLEEALARV